VAANPLSYTASAVVDSPAGGKWLSVGAQGGTTPAGVTILCDPTGLAAGSYSGRVLLSTAGFGGSSQTINVTLTVSSLAVVSTASGQARLAAGMIASLFGQGLAPVTDSATSTVLPTSLDGVSVNIADSTKANRAAPLFFISPGQINFQIPPAAASGGATLQVMNGSLVVASTTFQISPTAPGIFVVGKNVVAATALRVLADSSQVPVTVFECIGGAPCTTVPMDLSLGPVYVSIFATGIRNVTASSVVTCTIGGITVPVLFAGDQKTFPGLDQINIQLINALAGLGEADLVITVDGVASNAVKINIK